MEFTSLSKESTIGVTSGLGGMFVTILTQQVLAKRGLLTYFVRHNLVGLSTDDLVFGSVRVTWNDNPVANLFSSSVELVNQSMQDYENVVVRAFSNDTVLLTEKTEIVGTARILEWAPEFLQQLYVKPGEKATQAQMELHGRQRDYVIPVLNRGEAVRLHFLNAAKTTNQPTIWLDVLHKGVKLEFRVPQGEVMGVNLQSASLAGIALGFILLGVLVSSIEKVWVAALVSLAFGLVAQFPGALVVRGWRWLRNAFGG